MPPTMLGLIRLRVHEQMWSEDFHDGRRGGHLGYQNGIGFAVLNLDLALMPPIKFLLNPTYDLGGGVVLKIVKMALMAAMSDIGTENQY